MGVSLFLPTPWLPPSVKRKTCSWYIELWCNDLTMCFVCHPTKIRIGSPVQQKKMIRHASVKVTSCYVNTNPRFAEVEQRQAFWFPISMGLTQEVKRVSFCRSLSLSLSMSVKNECATHLMFLWLLSRSAKESWRDLEGGLCNSNIVKRDVEVALTCNTRRWWLSWTYN